LLPSAKVMTNDVNFRSADHRDIDSLLTLLQQLFSIEQDFAIDADKQRKGLQLLIEQKDALLLVGEVKSEVIGMCSLQRVISTAEGGYVGLVEDVVIDSAFRGRGIGRQLLTAMEQNAVAAGLLRIQLLADQDNSVALKFYGRNDWQQTALRALKKRFDPSIYE
jgi:ribosomal protein S18 acetylase RimI-like enzyme